MPSGLRFGVFEVNFDARELRKHGTRVRLRGQPFEILSALLDHPGQIVAREQLRARLWPADTFVDFEHSLNTAIKKLRAALGDSPEDSRYIETIPRVGYRFIAPVEEISARARDPLVQIPVALPGTSDSSLHQAPGQQVSSRKWPLFLLLPATVAGAVTLSILLRARPLPRVREATRLTVSSRVDDWGRIFTDGTRLFFLERRGHRWELMQMPASGGEAQSISHPFANMKMLAVSPDASEMVVVPFESRVEPLPVWLMPAVGGAPRRLGVVMASDAVYTRDGREITYCNRDGIFLVTRDGLNSRKLVNLQGSKSGLDWSPDGKALRFQWFNEQKATWSIWEAASNGRDLHEVLPGWQETSVQCCGRWTPDGRYYFFLAFDKNGSNHIWVKREKPGLFSRGTGPVALTTGPVPMNQFVPSRDGRRLFALGANSRSEYVRFDLRTREFRSLLGGADAAWASSSPDGEWVVYWSGADSCLWRSKLDGSDRRELAPAALQPAMPEVRPDGKEIAFRATPNGTTIAKIYSVPAEGGAPHELVSEAYPLTDPCWSPGGSKLTYAARSEAGEAAGIYVLDRSTGAKEKIPGSAGLLPARWSPDGKYLASVSENYRRVALFDWSTRKWRELVKGTLLGPLGWSSDSQFLYYQDVLEKDEPVHRIRIKDGKTERIVECQPLLEGGVQRCGFEGLLADGSPLLRLARGDHDVYSLEVELP